MILGALILDAVTDGKNVIRAMLIVGLIFLGTIAIGEYVAWRGRKKHEREHA